MRYRLLNTFSYEANPGQYSKVQGSKDSPHLELLQSCTWIPRAIAMACYVLLGATKACLSALCHVSHFLRPLRSPWFFPVLKCCGAAWFSGSLVLWVSGSLVLWLWLWSWLYTGCSSDFTLVVFLVSSVLCWPLACLVGWLVVCGVPL